MPLVRIDVLEGRSADERRALLDAVHAALVEAFQIPDDDRTQILTEHGREHFEIPPGRSDRYVLIQITAFPGRSVEAKRALYAALVDRLEAVGVPRGDVTIVLTEPPMENWGIRGGRSADQVDLGYDLDV